MNSIKVSFMDMQEHYLTLHQFHEGWFFIIIIFHCCSNGFSFLKNALKGAWYWSTLVCFGADTADVIMSRLTA